MQQEEGVLLHYLAMVFIKEACALRCVQSWKTLVLNVSAAACLQVCDASG